MISGKLFSVAFVCKHNRSNCRLSSISCLHSDHLEIFRLLFFVKVFCLIQFRLVGLKYSSNDGMTCYAEEIGARSFQNIKLNSLNSVVPVASFRSMSALSPIHAAVILLFFKDWSCSIILDFNGHAAKPKGNLGTNLCQTLISKSFTNARQNLVRILLAILHTHLFPLQFSARSCFVPFSFV